MAYSALVLAWKAAQSASVKLPASKMSEALSPGAAVVGDVGVEKVLTEKMVGGDEFYCETAG